MMLKKIINEVDFTDVWKYTVELYNDYNNVSNMAAHCRAFEKLMSMQPTVRDMIIHIEYKKDESFAVEDIVIEAGWDVFCTYESDSEKYALDFTPWSEWLGMEIDEVSLKELKPHEIVAHCLWEMTFFSFDEEETQQACNELKETIAQLENDDNVDEDDCLYDHTFFPKNEAGEDVMSEDMLAYKHESFEDVIRREEAELMKDKEGDTIETEPLNINDYIEGRIGRWRREHSYTPDGWEFSPLFYGYIGELYEEAIERERKCNNQ
jgi:hypothetical protein